MPAFADRTWETTTTTGTGAVTTSATAPTGYQTLATALGSSTRINVAYCIEHQTANEWETGKGTFNGTTGLTRDKVRDGSSGKDTLVDFSAGTKNVFVTVLAEHIDNANFGMQYAGARGCFAP